MWEEERTSGQSSLATGALSAPCLAFAALPLSARVSPVRKPWGPNKGGIASLQAWN